MVLQLFQHIVEARPIASVACRLVRVHNVQYRVRVAVDQNFVHWLDVAGFLALHPELVTRRAPEPGVARFECVVQGFLVGVGQHQDVLGLPVLHYDRKKTVALFKVDVLERLGVHTYMRI
jgi:hypothetical protein